MICFFLDDMGFCLNTPHMQHTSQSRMRCSPSPTLILLSNHKSICKYLQNTKSSPPNRRNKLRFQIMFFVFLVNDFFMAFQPGFVSDTTGRSLRYEFLIFTQCSNVTLLQSWFWSGPNTEPHRVRLDHYGLWNLGPLNFLIVTWALKRTQPSVKKVHHVMCFPELTEPIFCCAHTLQPQMTLRWICLCWMLETSSEIYVSKCCFFLGDESLGTFRKNLQNPKHACWGLNSLGLNIIQYKYIWI